MDIKTKYRPSLTAIQISHIIQLCKKETPFTVESAEIIGILAPFLAKIQNQAIIPSHTLKEKVSIEQKLGIFDSEAFPNNVQSKEQYWEWCHSEVNTKGIENCSVDVIKGYHEHRYLHGMMSPEEMYEHEQKAFGVQES